VSLYVPYDSTQGQECPSPGVIYLCSAFLHKLSDYLLAKLECCVVTGQHNEAATAAGSTERVPDGEAQPLASSSGRPESEAPFGPPQIGIIMGSDSDLKTMEAAEEVTHHSCPAASEADHLQIKHAFYAYMYVNCVHVMHIVHDICCIIHAIQAMMSRYPIARCSKAYCS